MEEDYVNSVAEQQHQIFDSKGIRDGTAGWLETFPFSFGSRTRTTQGARRRRGEERTREKRGSRGRGRNVKLANTVAQKRKGRMKRNEEGWIHAWEASRNAHGRTTVIYVDPGTGKFINANAILRKEPTEPEAGLKRDLWRMDWGNKTIFGTRHGNTGISLRCLK